MIGQDTDAVDYLNMAYDQGIGQIRADMIDLDGVSLADVQMQWQPAEITVGFSEVIIPGLLLQCCSG